ncbi:MAG: insulinase family protein [Chloroflexota bacterium]|nr:insulinase family protein [Chloroflexota bacterium]PLS78161.1 MAG: peptidase M16 [Chloroflexota bacterium]
MRYDQHVLPNGLTIVGEYNEDAQSVAIGFFTRTGSRDETPELSGVSHFLEHMMFKGSERRSAEEVDLEFDAMGARYNAFTSEENTVYYGAVLPEFQERLIDLLADMLRPSLRQDDFDTEKKVILEEIAMYKDRPQFTVYILARETYHHGHPLGNSVLGSTESITALQRDQMMDYFRRRYAPNNMVVTLTGKYDWNAAVAQIEQTCGGWAQGDSSRTVTEPDALPLERMQPDPKRDRVYLCAVAPAPSAQDDARYAAEVLAEVLGGGEGSRLYWALVHPGIADSADMSYSEQDGAGAFFVSATCDPERTTEVIDLLRSTLATAQNDGMSDDEIARARRKLASALVLRAETPMGRLVTVGFDYVYRRRIEPLAETVDKLLAVATDDVDALLRPKPFDKLTLVGYGPLAEAS